MKLSENIRLHRRIEMDFRLVEANERATELCPCNLDIQ